MNELKGNNVLKFGYVICCSCTRCLMACTNKQLRTRDNRTQLQECIITRRTIIPILVEHYLRTRN